MPLVRKCGKRNRGYLMTVCEMQLIPSQNKNVEPLLYEVCKEKCVMAQPYPGAAFGFTQYPGGPTAQSTRPRYAGGPLV